MIVRGVRDRVLARSTTAVTAMASSRLAVPIGTIVTSCSTMHMAMATTSAMVAATTATAVALPRAPAPGRAVAAVVTAAAARAVGGALVRSRSGSATALSYRNNLTAADTFGTGLGHDLIKYSTS